MRKLNPFERKALFAYESALAQSASKDLFCNILPATNSPATALSCCC